MSRYVGAHASSLPRLSLNLQPRVHGDLKKNRDALRVRVCVFVRLVRHIIRRPPPPSLAQCSPVKFCLNKAMCDGHGRTNVRTALDACAWLRAQLFDT